MSWLGETGDCDLELSIEVWVDEGKSVIPRPSDFVFVVNSTSFDDLFGSSGNFPSLLLFPLGTSPSLTLLGRDDIFVVDLQ